jgi:hypothetical protein
MTVGLGIAVVAFTVLGLALWAMLAVGSRADNHQDANDRDTKDKHRPEEPR